MNIWDYQGISKTVLIRTKTGNSYLGRVLSVLDADDLEADEPQISIETNSGIYGIWESEIASIEIVED